MKKILLLLICLVVLSLTVQRSVEGCTGGNGSAKKKSNLLGKNDSKLNQNANQSSSKSTTKPSPPQTTKPGQTIKYDQKKPP